MSQTKAQLIDPVDGTIVNADINASAAIAGTKISPDFGSQVIATTGVTNLSAELRANGNIKITNAGPKISFVDSDNDSDFEVKNGDGIFTVRDSTNSADRFAIDSSGFVGIGNTSPSSSHAGGRDLVIGSGSGDRGLSIMSGTSGVGHIEFSDGTSSAAEKTAGGIRYYHNGNYMRFNTNGGTERMRIKNDGKVGIGTTSPAGKVHANSAADTATFLAEGEVDNPSYPSYGFSGQNADNGSRGAGMYLPGDNTLAFSTTGSERIRIDGSGNVGIGTNAPDVKLDVARLGSAWTGRDPVAGTAAHFHNGNNSSSSPAYLGLGAGTASISGIHFGDADDADVGRIHYSHSDNSLRFGTNASAEKMRIDSSGFVGIGTSSPGSELHVSALGASDEPTIRCASENSTIFLRTAGSSGAFPTGGGGNDGELTYVGGDFRLGIGTASKNLIFFNGAGYTERMRIDDAGALVIGGTTANGAGTRLNLYNGASLFWSEKTGTGNHSNFVIVNHRATGNTKGNALVFRNSALSSVGTIRITNTGTEYNTTSDYRLKENVVEISDGITRLKALKPSRFNFIADETNTLVDGFLAHEVSSVIPEAISGEKDAVVTQALLDSEEETEGKVGDPIYQEIDQSKIVPLITAALKEAVAKIETLETKVAALEAA